jgi:hypothetical protein
MGVRQKYAWELSGWWTMAVRMDNCATGFSENFAEKSFLYKNIVRTDARPLQVISITGFARPDHGAGASGRLNFNTQFPYLMRVSPDHEGETSGRLKSNRQLQTPHLAILGQKSLDRFGNTFLVQNKNYSSFFVTKGQRVNRVIKQPTKIKITPPNGLRRTQETE